MASSIIVTFIFALVSCTFADPGRPGQFLEHDRTVVNCARYKREANQHSCVLSPFETEGPYFLPDDLERSDITDGQTGYPLDFTVRLVNSNDCSPLSNMFVHLWHANAVGSYSGVGGGHGPGGRNSGKAHEMRLPGSRNGPERHDGPDGPGGHGGGGGGGGGGGRPTPTSDERYLRGYQITNEVGEVNFKTIFPGWYAGRCVHIHIEVYAKNSTEQSDITYVGQIFFDDDIPNQLASVEPYTGNRNRITPNAQDGIYGHHGSETTAQLEQVGSGFSTVMTFGIDPTATRTRH